MIICLKEERKCLATFRSSRHFNVMHYWRRDLCYLWSNLLYLVGLKTDERSRSGRVKSRGKVLGANAKSIDE